MSTCGPRHSTKWVCPVILTVLAALASCKPTPLPPGAAQPLDFKLILKTVCQDDGTPVFPPKLLELENRRISVSGFMAPYDDPHEMNKIMLTKSSASCYFCNPPEENGVVFIRLSSQEKPPEAETGNITVEGTLHLIRRGCQDEEAKQFLYTIDDARITKLAP
ncbi:MAG: DUF3299 domain-containing protein [Luteolibacter sp.]